MNIEIRKLDCKDGRCLWSVPTSFTTELIAQYYSRDPLMIDLPFTGTVLKLMLAGF